MTTQLLRRNDPSWTKAPFGELTRLAWPIAISTLSYSVMTLVDTLFVGRLGASALAGVGLGGTVSFALLCLSIGLLRGVKVLVSQACGAGQQEQSRAYLGAGIALGAALGCLTVAVGQLVVPLVGAITASAAAGDAAETYMRIRLLGAPLLLVYVALRESRYGIGDSHTPMVGSLIGNGLNIALDYILIVHVGLGVAGAAWATVAAQLAECGVLAWAQPPEGYGLRRWRWRHVTSVFRVGLPTGIQFTLEVGAFVLLAALISALSEAEMAAHQIALQVIHVSFLPAFAVAEAASILVGQAVGADRDDLVLPVARMAMTVSGIYTAVCTGIFALLAWPIAGVFTTELDVQHTAMQLLYVAAVFQVADAANIVARATLRGTGDVRVPAVIGIVTAWVLTPPLTWLLGYRLGLGALGGWIGLCTEIILGASLLWWRLRWGFWRSSAERSRAELRKDAANSP
jgi:MATE family multidrug resistance protein